jgi:hypothetical protein
LTLTDRGRTPPLVVNAKALKKGAGAMTITGKVFKAYAAAIEDSYGFGSSKMVRQGSPAYINREIMRGQRLVDRATWANEKTSILLEEYEAAMAGRAEGLRIWEGIAAAEKWLLENGWLRKYEAFYTYRKGRGYGSGMSTNIGLTAKGWAVARKYINAD